MAFTVFALKLIGFIEKIQIFVGLLFQARRKI
jgi:hypothetical protein